MIRNRFLKTLVISLAPAALLLAGPAAAQNCISFQGIDHCPVDDATLNLSADGLGVQNHGGISADGLGVQNHGGMSGVSSQFAPTVLWQGRMAFPQESHSTHFASISGGETTSRLLIEPVGDDGSYSARAVFTGASEQPTYSVLVYNDGVLQGALGNFDGSEPTQAARMFLPGRDTGYLPQTRPVAEHNSVNLPPDPIPVDPYPWWWPRFIIYFHIATSGGCNWTLATEEPMTFELPDGQTLEGDEIRFTEDTFGPGHYPYLGFESIETVSTASGFTITDELVDSGGCELADGTDG